MAGNDWHLAGPPQTPLDRKIFCRRKKWLEFTSPSLFYPARRIYKQYIKFVTVAAQFLSADGMYRTRRCRKMFSWNDNLSALALESPSLTSADEVQGISVKLTSCVFPWSCSHIREIKNKWENRAVWSPFFQNINWLMLHQLQTVCFWNGM